MKNIMVIYLSIAKPEAVIKRVIELAEPEKTKITSIFIFEDTIPKALSSTLAYIGFLGEKMKSDMEKTIVENYHQQVSNISIETEKQARVMNVNTDSLIIKGDIKTEIFSLIELSNIDYVIINDMREDYLSNRSYINQPDLITESLNIGYEVYFEGEKG